MEALLYKYERPAFVALVETFSDGSIESPTLSGYEQVARRDRGGLRQKGGNFLFARTDLLRYVVHLADSDVAERTWIIIHNDQMPTLFGLWYRPPTYGEIGSIESLSTELVKYGANAMGIFLCGDMNVHHIGWLRYLTAFLLEDGICSIVIRCSIRWNIHNNLVEGNIYWMYL